MVAEGVPRQLARYAVILMEIGPLVGEDQIWRQLALELLEEPLDLGTVIGEVPVAEVLEDHALARGVAEQRVGALTRFGGASGLACQDDPADLRQRSLFDQLEDCPPAADLDVVRMGADREQPQGLAAGAAAPGAATSA